MPLADGGTDLKRFVVELLQDLGTALRRPDEPAFEEHLDRFLAYTRLDALQWINVTRAIVRFRTLRKRGKKAD